MNAIMPLWSSYSESKMSAREASCDLQTQIAIFVRRQNLLHDGIQQFLGALASFRRDPKNTFLGNTQELGG